MVHALPPRPGSTATPGSFYGVPPLPPPSKPGLSAAPPIQTCDDHQPRASWPSGVYTGVPDGPGAAQAPPSWRLFKFSPEHELSPEEYRAGRVLGKSPPEEPHANFRYSASPLLDEEPARTEAPPLASPQPKMRIDLASSIIMNDPRIPLPPALHQHYADNTAFMTTAQTYAANFSRMMPGFAFRLIPASFDFTPGRASVEFACDHSHQGCPFRLKAAEAGTAWQLVAGVFVHEHAVPAKLPPPMASKAVETLLQPMHQAPPPVAGPSKPSAAATTTKKRPHPSTDDEDEDDEPAATDARKGGTLSVTHPKTGVTTVVKLKNTAAYPIIYGKDLPKGELPPIHSVWMSREHFKEALDAHGAACVPPNSFKATSSNRTPGKERIVFSCRHYAKSKGQLSCSFMIRAKRMVENGLWVVTTTQPDHNELAHTAAGSEKLNKGKGKEKPAEAVDNGFSLQPPRSARRAAKRFKEESEDPPDRSGSEEPARAARKGRGKTAKTEESDERDASPGLVGNFKFRSERTPLSDDEPAKVGQAAADEDVHEDSLSDLSVESDLDLDKPVRGAGRGRGRPRGGRGGRGGGATGRILPAKVRKYEFPHGVLVADATDGQFDTRMPWPANKRLLALNLHLHAYLAATTLIPDPPAPPAALQPEIGEAVDAYLGRLHPALAACAPALAQRGINDVQGLLAMSREELAGVNGLTGVQQVLLKRVPLQH